MCLKQQYSMWYSIVIILKVSFNQPMKPNDTKAIRNSNMKEVRRKKTETIGPFHHSSSAA